MARQLRRATLLAPFMLLAGFLALSCFDNTTGPRIFQGQFALAPQFASSVAQIVAIDRFRVLLRRTSDSSVALDTVITVVPGSDSVDLSLSVPMLTSSETFLLTLSLITPAGDTAFQAGPTTVTASSSGSAPPAIPVTVVYVGVGAQAVSVRIVTDGASVFFGDTVTLAAEALDSTGGAIPGTPIAWGSLDTLRARVPNATQGNVVGAIQRGTARITATLPTGLADTSGLRVQPLPVRAAVESGNNQSAQVAALLAQPVRFRVKAADSLGVSGLKVRFSVATGGGSLNLDSAVTNDSGRVDVQWTLGPSTGTQTIRARVAAAFADSVITASATALGGIPDSLAFVVAPVTTTAGRVIAPPIQVAVLDSFGNTVTGVTTAVTLAIRAGTGTAGAILQGTTTQSAVAGIATFADLRIDSAGTAYRLDATATGLAGATSSGFDVGPPGLVVWLAATSGNWSDGARWSTGAPPSPLDTVLITQAGTYTVTLDVAAAFAALIIGGSTGSQTLAVNGQTVTVGNSLAVVPNGVMDFGSGTITGPGAVSIYGALNWTGGTMNDTGATLVGPGGLLRIDGGGAKYLQARTLVNDGTIVFPPGTGTGSLYLSDAATIDNLGLVDVGTDASLVHLSGLPSTFTNAGTFQKSGGVGTTNVADVFTNTTSGTIAGAGNLQFTGTFTNDGAVSPGTSLAPTAVLAFGGNQALQQTSAVDIELNGTAVGTQHDQWSLGGTVALDGALNLTTGFTPQLNDNFLVMTFASRTGQFGSITGLGDLYPTTGTSLTLDTVWQPTALSIKADGQIAFSSDSAGGLPLFSGLIRTNASSTFRVNVSPEGRLFDAYPRWSPDRARLVHTPNDSLKIVDAGEGGTSVQLVTDMWARRARYSPNGIHLAFECGGIASGITDVCTIADVTNPAAGMGDGTGKAVVTDSVNAGLSGPPAFAWNPTNPSQLAVVRDTLILGWATSRVYLMNYDGTGVTLLRTLPGARRIVETMDWSPDGTMLAFSVRNDSTGGQQIWTLTVPGGVVDTVSAPAGFGAVLPVFSPDGAEILFLRDAGSCEMHYVITSAATGVERVEIPTTLYCEGATDAGHDWSPDGSQMVLVDGSLTEPNLVYVVPSSVAAASYLSLRSLVGWPLGFLNASSRNPSWRP